MRFSLVSRRFTRQNPGRRFPLVRRTLPQLLLAIFACTGTAAAQIDVALSPFPVLQIPAAYQTFGDGSGGAWGVFQGATPGAGLYAQHVLANGNLAARFTPAGLLVANSGTLVNGMSAAPDGIGGALIQWFGVNPRDSTSQFPALRCQHLDPQGLNQFADSGLVVSSIATAALVLGDGLGGVYVAWEELKGPSNPDIVAQRFDNSGTALWTPSGSPTGRNVCAVVGIQRLRAIQDDGAGGAFVVWADSRTSSTTPLYSMRLTPAGPALAPWPTNGLRVTPVTSGIRIVGSGASPGSGLWLAWRDIGGPNQFLAQHIAPDASLSFPVNGAIVATVTPARAEFVAASAGDVFVTWGGTDIRCARINAAGTRIWAELDGRIMVAPPTSLGIVHAATDGAGGQRLAWSYDNSGQSDVNILDVNAGGAPLAGWPALGQPFATTTLVEEPVAWLRPETTTPALTWLAGGKLYVRLPQGALGVGPGLAAGRLGLSPPYPNPLRGQALSLRFAAPPGPARLELFDAAGRRVLTRALYSNGGSQSLSLAAAAELAPGVYSLRLTAAGQSATQRLVRVE